jgi:mannose-1-phosphate guanylyltransferase
MEPSVLDRIDADRRVSIERETFPVLVHDRSLFAAPDGGVYWLDTGTPEDYLNAQLDVIAGRRGAPDGSPVTAVDPTAIVAATATVRSSVIGPGVRIEEHAEVIGSAVQPGAAIGAKARVIDSLVGAGARIGDGTTLEALCVVGDGETVGAGVELLGARVPAPES